MPEALLKAPNKMRRRLEGRRILVLRPEGQAEDLARALTAEGADAVVVPAIRILPLPDTEALDAALRREHDWVLFTSTNGVAAARETIPGATLTRVAAVGPATAEALASAGVAVDFVPSAYTTAALASELPGPPSRVCVVRAEAAGPDLEAILSERGYEVERVNAYRTEPSGHHLIVEALDDGVDGVALTSASITEAFADAAGHPPDTRGAAIFSIGPATTAACRRAGLTVTAEAPTHTIPGLVATIADTMEI
ncbi:MAG: uroporphyrinogen-III C-methyltransferase [Actinobacteria bacterium]|nr:uroporphyrinogen-III C-methyltransferase [Actinomycetota bacterium]